jgi:protein phosphatase PTC1
MAVENSDCCDAQGTDPVEVKRIQDAGGLVVLNRVSGILAVTRSLGDLKLKARE